MSTEPRKLLRVVIKEEFVVLTGNVYEAVILQQMLYWQERVRDYDRMVAEEKSRMEAHEMPTNFEAANGWIYKKADELAEETLLAISGQTIRRHLTKLVKKGLLLERRNPNFKWDKTLQYRIDFSNLIQQLHAIGYRLEGYSSLPLPNLQSGVSKLHDGGSNNQLGDSELQSGDSERQFGGAIPEITTEITPDKGIIPVGEQAPDGSEKGVFPSRETPATKGSIPDDRNPTSGDEITNNPNVPDLQKTTAILFLQLGKKKQLSDDDISCLKMLFKIHTPAAIQKNILQAFERLEKNGSVKVEFEGKEYTISKAENLPIRYIWNSMKNWTSLKGTGGAKNGKKRTGKVSRGNPNRDSKDYRGEDGDLFA